ncbi:MAG: hypothetical protein DSM107014_11315 [Gomphosphaeria aponina SAG 52.96 = DSM 107014]|uniref:Uncharacterized protein n=1 Tax=Gomphosphaeria aponina SAG 52.96 = DSM 107014 TaxID=1521640 RepID=A0A941GW15_9CHRO|nr:hypothetical protein [Gomphosphaeria aponina SAG 52.96 = DSM 107014]
MTFNAQTDKIAITIPSFSIKKTADHILLEEVSDLLTIQPYLVTLAIDSNGITQKSLEFNLAEYPNTHRGDTVIMLGDGHLVYGPENPGEFVAISVLLMESDSNARDLGETLSEIVLQTQSNEFLDLANAALNVQAQMVTKSLSTLTQVITNRLKNEKDDFLLNTSGTFLRDMSTPYGINRQITRNNDLAELSFKVIPLNTPNGQGATPKKITLQ